MSDSHRDDRRRWWIKEQLKRTFLRDKLRGAFVSGSLAAQYMESLGIPPNRIWKGYDAVDNHFFAEHARRVRNDSDRIRLNLELPERYFLYVGRLAPEKNIETLLLSYDSYRKIAKKHIANLVIVGSGASESHLKTLCQQNRIRGVDWRQFQQQSQLVELYALSSGLILPSRSEPWGLVVNEALASGIPVVVSSNCGCAPELVLPGLNGWVFDVGNSSTLTENLLRLHALGPHELNDIRQISAALVSLFSLENWCRAVKDIICQIGPKEPSY
jgi:glycosyltransferase involved in cell wall biosynthesis